MDTKLSNRNTELVDSIAVGLALHACKLILSVTPSFS